MKPNGSNPKNQKTASRPEKPLLHQKDNYLFLLKTRDQIRNWFKNKGYLEVLLPTLSPETVPDLNLESFSVSFQSVFDPKFKRQLFLQTSPELLMKRLIVAGMDKIFYLGPAFRQGELSKLHHPEFTILEWYQKSADYFSLMAELEDLLWGLFGIKKPISRCSMRDAFIASAGFDFLKFPTTKHLAKFIQTKIPGFKAEAKSWEELFEFAFLEWLEPWLKEKEAVFLYDWPSQLAMQAKLKPEEPRLCQRFELYLKGIELANGYTEETEPEEMKKRLDAEIKKRKKLGRKLVPLPGKFVQSLKLGLPECAGASLGLERLCLVLLGIDSLDFLMPFREI